jgi:hypothetical protein
MIYMYLLITSATLYLWTSLGWSASLHSLKNYISAGPQNVVTSPNQQ